MTRLARPLTPAQAATLDALVALGRPTLLELAAARGLSYTGLRRHLDGLAAKGVVTREPFACRTVVPVRPYAVGRDGRVTPLVEVPAERAREG